MWWLDEESPETQSHRRFWPQSPLENQVISDLSELPSAGPNRGPPFRQEILGVLHLE